ncbi:MAG TPA: hypothetical protein VN782_08470 [Usitatibacter sp.]|nr:hypothetical protein [Usitatibacter sp.]
MMKSVARGVLIWIAAFAVTYVAMIIINSVGAGLHSGGPSYGASRVQQEISGFTRLLVHVVPAIAVGYWQPAPAWKIAGVMSLITEGVNAMQLTSHAGFPYVGAPVAEIAAYVLLGIFAASTVASWRRLRSA